MKDSAPQGDRLKEILVRNRAEVADGLPESLLLEIAEIEEQNQFDDDRRAAQSDIRDAVVASARSLRLNEVIDR